jgi:hypothetical protein
MDIGLDSSAHQGAGLLERRIGPSNTPRFDQGALGALTCRAVRLERSHLAGWAIQM